ncbi:hypothetical protein OSB04_001452 [Centaurea solstitialis]|uniref:DUF4283 domain-containing protein n=1 Tax=Centaurea solstitialis TaxID=347529 RepID=A0AA38U3M0_9ASTR|nr:hypothetical protein OSB04_001452 [Centaurea solstitialis]
MQRKGASGSKEEQGAGNVLSAAANGGRSSTAGGGSSVVGYHQDDYDDKLGGFLKPYLVPSITNTLKHGFVLSSSKPSFLLPSFFSPESQAANNKNDYDKEKKGNNQESKSQDDDTEKKETPKGNNQESKSKAHVLITYVEESSTEGNKRRFKLRQILLVAPVMWYAASLADDKQKQEKISFEKFKNELLEPGLVDHIVISNGSVAKVYVRNSPHNKSTTDKGSWIDSPANVNTSQYKCCLVIGSSVESFKKKLEEAQEALGIETHDYVPVAYAFKVDWRQECRREMAFVLMLGSVLYLHRNMQGTQALLRVTRNQARQRGQNSGSASPALSTSIPATTAAVPACGGADSDRPPEGYPVVASICQTNTTAAASFFSLDPKSPLPPLVATPSLTAAAAATLPLGSLSGVVGTGDTTAAALSTTDPPSHLVSPADMSDVAEPVVETPAGTTGVFGDVGSFQQLLRDVSGAHGHQQQSPMLSPAAAMFSSFLASLVGMGSGRGVLPTASVSNSEAATLSSPGRSLKPSADKFDEVGSDLGNDPTVSVEKAPNVGSFVESEGKVHLHAEESGVAHKPVSFADLLKKSANLVSSKGKLKYYPPVVTELGTRRAIIPDELVQKQASEWALTLAGYFIGKRPAFPFVQYHARRMWKKYGLTDVILNDQGYFFFKFNSDQGLNFVFENGPWLFNGMPIFIQRWQQGHCFDKPELKTVPLWVNIYGLPLDVWDYEIISRIASVVGEPVSCVKPSLVELILPLVNVSADYDLPSDIDAIILGKLRKFKTEFLWKPMRCSHCKVFGHDFEKCVVRPRTADEVKKVNPVVGESSKPKDDGFNFPKRKKKPKPTVDPLKVGPKVVGIKINQRYVPKVILPTIDPLDKGKAKLNDDNPSPKAPKFNTERIPMPVKVSNQFTILEEDPQWILDKQEIDDFIEKRGVGLEPVIINSWSRTKLDYFIGRWERVFGKEPDGTLRGFTFPDRQIISDDDGSDSDSEDDAELVEDVTYDATLGTPDGTWLRQKQDIDRRLAEKDWPTATQMATWTDIVGWGIELRVQRFFRNRNRSYNEGDMAKAKFHQKLEIKLPARYTLRYSAMLLCQWHNRMYAPMWPALGLLRGARAPVDDVMINSASGCLEVTSDGTGGGYTTI